MYDPQYPPYQGLELTLALIGVFVGTLNSLQTLLDQVYPKRARGGQSSVKPFYHGLLAIGGIIISIGAFIAAFQIHGKLFAGSESCNEILAYLFTIGLLRVLYATLGVLRVFSGEHIRCRVFTVLVVLTVLVIITPILWILGLIWMFKRDNRNKWKLLSYVPNGVTLCVLSFTLLLFAIFFLPKQIKTVQEPKRRHEVYMRLILIFIFSALLGGYTLYDAHKVYETNSPFISYEQRPEATVRSTVITRLIAEFFLVTFTFLMWSPLHPKAVAVKPMPPTSGPRESVTKPQPSISPQPDTIAPKLPTLMNGHYEQTTNGSTLTSDAFKTTPSTTPVTPSILTASQPDDSIFVHGDGNGLPGGVEEYKIPMANDSPPDSGKPIPPPIPAHYLSRGRSKSPPQQSIETQELLRPNVPSSSSTSTNSRTSESKTGLPLALSVLRPTGYSTPTDRGSKSNLIGTSSSGNVSNSSGRGSR